MRAIRAVNPDAKLVQTDDLGKTYSTPEMAERGRVLQRAALAGLGPAVRQGRSASIRCGTTCSQPGIRRGRTAVVPRQPLPAGHHRRQLLRHQRALAGPPRRALSGAPPRHYRGIPYADIEAPRALATPTPGIAPLLQETWERYGLPLAVTEAHIDANREDQLRWLLEIWDAAKQARAERRRHARRDGLGAARLVRLELPGHRSAAATTNRARSTCARPQPRPTALARLMRELAAGTPLSHPVLQRPGLVAPAGPLPVPSRWRRRTRG